jgi:hypothetical protein
VSPPQQGAAAPALLCDGDEPPRQGSAIQELPIEIAKPIIAQCRREIAAGLAQVEAARAELKRTRGMHERWAKQIRAVAAAMAAQPPRCRKSCRTIGRARKAS